MKKFIFVIFLLALVTSVFSQSEKTLRTLGVTTKETWVNSNSKTKYLETLEKFDKEGNLIEEIKYTLEKSIRKHSKWTYNENSDKLTETIYDGSNKIISRIEYTYDGKLRASRKEYNEKGKLISWKTYMYEFTK